MPNTYTQIFYHLVWSTKDREPFITPAIERRLYGLLRSLCVELGADVHALGGVEDHVHLVVSIPARIALAEVVHKLKGTSSHYFNHRDDGSRLYWQPGYGALTFSRRDLSRVTEYVRNQRQHHRDGRLSAEMERWGEDVEAR